MVKPNNGPPKRVDIQSNLDHATRIATVKIQEGLSLPVTVNIPYVAIKHMAANILMSEVVHEAGTVKTDSQIVPPSGGPGPKFHK